MNLTLHGLLIVEKYKKISFVVPGSINQLTGGYIYDKKIATGLVALGHKVEIIELAGTFPIINDSTIENANRQLKECTNILLIDGLALPAFPNSENFYALIHHPLFKETNLTQETKNFLFHNEKKSLQKARHIIVTSNFTKKELQKEYNIPKAKISVVCPGNEKVEIISHKSKSKHKSNIHLLCVASITPRKGHDVLLKSLAPLRHLPWKLFCVGSLNRDKEATKNAMEIVCKNQLEDKVIFTGELDDKAVQEKYFESDIFVLASFYEGYGMVLTEAISYGLPIVSTTGGAIPHVVGKEGILIEPGNVEQMTNALSRIISDAKLRENLHEKAMEARKKLPSWRMSCEKFQKIFF